MIFQPGSGGSGGGLTANTGSFASRFSVTTVSLGFKAKVCIVAYDESADNVGFLVAGGSTDIRTENGEYSSVSLSSDGMTLSSSSQSRDNAIRYLALG